MLYDIKLSISYDYERLADAGRHLLRLQPLNLDGEQRVVSSFLNVEPVPTERSDRIDFFGNQVVDVSFGGTHSDMSCSVRARVDRIQTPPTFDISTPRARIAEEANSVANLAPDAPVHFLGESPRIALDPIMTAYAESHVSADMTSMEAVCAIGTALFNDMEFDPIATTADTRAAEAFERKRGVCQDFTHIMIACLRGISIPAGYVSGFLRTLPPENGPRLEGSDAMHAWVRAWCGQEFGWLEFDPTNAIAVGTDHIVVARGRDYSDVNPINGTMRTSGDQTSSQAVDVIPLL